MPLKLTYLICEAGRVSLFSTWFLFVFFLLFSLTRELFAHLGSSVFSVCRFLFAAAVDYYSQTETEKKSRQTVRAGFHSGPCNELVALLLLLFLFFLCPFFPSPSLHLPVPQRVRKFDQLIKLIGIESIIEQEEENRGKAPTGIMDDVFARVPDCRYCSRIGLFMFSLSVCYSSSSMLNFFLFFPRLRPLLIHIHVLHIWRIDLFSSVCCW